MTRPMQFPEDTELIDEANWQYINGERPRPVDANIGCGIVFALMFLVLGLVCLGIGVLIFSEDVDLDLYLNGSRTTGTVTAKSLEFDAPSDVQFTASRTLRLEFTFAVDNEPNQVTQFVREDNMPGDRFQPGTEITVAYDAENPRDAVIFYAPPIVLLAVVFGLPTTLLAVLAVLMAVRNANRYKRAQVLVGEVTESDYSPVYLGYHITVHYTFHSPHSMTTVKGKYRGGSSSPAPKAGAHVAVVYWSDKRNRII